MATKLIKSTLDIVGWLCHKALADKQTLSSQQLQNLLFLVQMHHIGKEGKVLVPSMFVCCRDGFYEPTVESVLSQKLPLLKMPTLEPNISLLLESVWQKYAHLSEKELLNFVTSLSCWKETYNTEKEVVINPLDIASSFSLSISKDKNFSPSKIRLSQNGPVQVSPWRPRKLGNTSNLNKKEN